MNNNLVKFILIFVVGLAIGGLVIYGLTNKTSDNKIQIAQKPAISPTPNQRSTSPVVTETEEEKLERLKTQLYEQGIIVTAKADTVYPGIGFILIDESNTKMFVHFTKGNIEEGQTVNVDGTIKKITGQEAFRNDSDFTEELDEFLKNQQIYIEAKDVKATGQ